VFVSDNNSTFQNNSQQIQKEINNQLQSKQFLSQSQAPPQSQFQPQSQSQQAFLSQTQTQPLSQSQPLTQSQPLSQEKFQNNTNSNFDVLKEKHNGNNQLMEIEKFTNNHLQDVFYPLTN